MPSVKRARAPAPASAPRSPGPEPVGPEQQQERGQVEPGGQHLGALAHVAHRLALERVEREEPGHRQRDPRRRHRSPARRSTARVKRKTRTTVARWRRRFPRWNARGDGPPDAWLSAKVSSVVGRPPWRRPPRTRAGWRRVPQGRVLPHHPGVVEDELAVEGRGRRRRPRAAAGRRGGAAMGRRRRQARCATLPGAVPGTPTARFAIKGAPRRSRRAHVQTPAIPQQRWRPNGRVRQADPVRRLRRGGAVHAAHPRQAHQGAARRTSRSWTSRTAARRWRPGLQAGRAVRAEARHPREHGRAARQVPRRRATC